MNFRCVVHGSFRKHFREIQKAREVFSQNGIEVLAPSVSEIVTFQNKFAILESDDSRDQRMIELLYLSNLRRLGEGGFSYFIDPGGYIGKSASYELGIAQATNVRCFFSEAPKDLPVFFTKNSILSPENLIDFIKKFGIIPIPKIRRNERIIKMLYDDLLVPGSVVAVGAIIEYEPKRKRTEKEVLLVKTHKWGGKYSVVGEKVKRHERLDDALLRGIREETGLSATVGRHICTFDQIKNSGYFLSGINHIFVDKVVNVQSKKVRLNGEAQEFVWATPKEALAHLPIEPNAMHTLELYLQQPQ